MVATYRYMEDAGELSGKYVFVRKSERRINDCAFELVMPPVGGVGVLAYGNGHVEEQTGWARLLRGWDVEERRFLVGFAERLLACYFEEKRWRQIGGLFLFFLCCRMFCLCFCHLSFRLPW